MITGYALPGVKTKLLNIRPDERGIFSEAMRMDWVDLIDSEIVQANFSQSFPDVVRAWHRHNRGQVDYFLVLKGAMKVCAFEEQTGKMVEIIGSEYKPALIRIPGLYWHGTKNIGDCPSLLLYFTNKLYEYSDPDEERRPWNDPLLIPKEINGNKDDVRINQPWDWFYQPFK